MQSSSTENAWPAIQARHESSVNRRRIALILFWVGVLVAALFAAIGT